MKSKKNSRSNLPKDDFWETHDATEHLDLSPEKQVHMIYEPPVQSISLRLPLPLLNQIRQIASNMDIAYQALIKVWLSEKAAEKAKG